MKQLFLCLSLLVLQSEFNQLHAEACGDSLRARRNSNIERARITAETRVRIPNSSKGFRKFQLWSDGGFIVKDLSGDRVLVKPSGGELGSGGIIKVDDSAQFIAVTTKEPIPGRLRMSERGDGHGIRKSLGFGVFLFYQTGKSVRQIKLLPNRDMPRNTYGGLTEYTEFSRQDMLISFAPSNGDYTEERNGFGVPRSIALSVIHSESGRKQSTSHHGIQFLRLDGTPYWTAVPSVTAEEKFYLDKIETMEFSLDGTEMLVSGRLDNFQRTRVNFRLNLKSRTVTLVVRPPNEEGH